MHAHDLGLGRRLNGPAKWKGKVLRFSKSGERALEEAYSQVFFVIGSQEKFVRKLSGTERLEVSNAGANTANAANLCGNSENIRHVLRYLPGCMLRRNSLD